MNEDLIEKIATFIERQCPRKIFPGTKCSEYNCSVHWLAAQVRGRKFEVGAVQVENITVDVMR